MTSDASQETDIYDIANCLREDADDVCANAGLKASEYSVPALGRISLTFADSRFTKAE